MTLPNKAAPAVFSVTLLLKGLWRKPYIFDTTNSHVRNKILERIKVELEALEKLHESGRMEHTIQNTFIKASILSGFVFLRLAQGSLL